MTALCARLVRNPLSFEIQSQQQRIRQLKVRLDFSMTKNTSFVQQHLAALCARLDNLSPLKVLTRGYSVTENERGETLT